VVAPPARVSGSAVWLGGRKPRIRQISLSAAQAATDGHEAKRRAQPRSRLCSATFVAMMQATNLRNLHHGSNLRRLHGAGGWSILVQPVERSDRPSVGFSAAMDRMSFRSSRMILGRPGRLQESQRQYQRNPARCQLTTVSGFTITKALAHLDHTLRSASQNRRSRRLNLGRELLRLRTPSCCRKAASSSPRSFRQRKNAPNQERKARKSRVIQPAYMTDSTGRRACANR
jgi:hypothetical protein